MLKKIPLILILCCLTFTVFGQGKFAIQNEKNYDKIKFKLLNDLVLIPVEINGVKLSFILDTGVSKVILFNIFNINETLKVKNSEKIFIRGLGEGDSVEALRSKNNVIQIGDALSINQDLYVVYNSKLNFAPRLGVPVHGIIGYDFFKDLVVEINYSGKYLKIYEPDNYLAKSCKNCETLDLEFFNNKPYMNAQVGINNKNIPVKLLIDSGGSDSLWIFEDKEIGLTAGEQFFEDFLGHGLNGSVYGKRTKVKTFAIKSFKLQNANVAFPDSTSILLARQFESRNGSLAGNMLKRFNVIFNYKNKTIQLKKSKYFKEPFSYNKSGIELEHNGIRLVKELKRKAVKGDNALGSNNANRTEIIFEASYKLAVKPAYTIVELRKNSPAAKAGLQIGDIILKINGKETYNYSLQEIMYYFYEKDGKKIKLKVDRLGKERSFQFQLESLF
ncbi:MAG: aspartyl protease family protein [Oceanihabitans sp.]